MAPGHFVPVWEHLVLPLRWLGSVFLGQPKISTLLSPLPWAFDFPPKISTAKCRGHRRKQVAGKAAAEKGLWMGMTGAQWNPFPSG